MTQKGKVISIETCVLVRETFNKTLCFCFRQVKISKVDISVTISQSKRNTILISSGSTHYRIFLRKKDTYISFIIKTSLLVKKKICIFFLNYCEVSYDFKTGLYI